MDIESNRRMFVGGEWTHTESGVLLDCWSPSTGKSLGSVPNGTRTDVGAACAAAAQAQPAWAAVSPFERSAKLLKVAELLDQRRDRLAWALTLDQGKPLHSEAMGEVDELIEHLEWAAGDAVRSSGDMPASASADKRVMIYRVPRGVVGVIAAWNWPYTMAGELIAPALASGNSVVWTPSPSTAWCSTVLTECFADADLPAGVFNVVTGEGSVVSDELAGHPLTNAVAFVGSVPTGKLVARRAAGKATLLELGGNGPMVLFDDGDVAAAAQASLTDAFLCAGQSCTAGERFLVHESVYDAFIEEIVALASKDISLGDPFSETTTMGPVNNEGVASKCDAHIADASQRGARVLAGGGRVSGYPSDLYYAATILADVTEDMDIAVEETFGPVAPIMKISSDAEALRLVNESEFGLMTAVWTNDLARGLRFAEQANSGLVNINESSNYWEPHLPFGGRSGKKSGVGRVGGRYVLDTFTEPKTVIVDLARFKPRGAA